MSFFKKLLGTQDKTPEELEADRIKKMEKQAEAKRQEELRKREFEEKQRERDDKKAQEKALQEKYIGLGFGTGLDFSLLKGTIHYFESFVLQPNENVLHSIKAEYDKTKKREIKGLLIATDQRLVFVSSGAGYGQFIEEFDYRKMNGIVQANERFSEKVIYIDMGRSRKKFDDIIPNERFNQFVNVVTKQINEIRNSPINRNPSTKTKNVDKYTNLEKIAKLKEQGILTEEEFLIEKEKILKS
ncbi:PH domain-containing protein [Lysinibacillus fusiformis]|uniref:PH domain-containing protein n=1 Tax=Lysinibacillus fusiformis TaxID=28031 RepID=UPI00381D44DA